MPHEVICHRCGEAIPLDPLSDSLDSYHGHHAAQTVETVIPGTFCGDDTAVPDGLDGEVAYATPLDAENGPGFVIEDDTEMSELPSGGSVEALPAYANGSGEFDPLACPR